MKAGVIVFPGSNCDRDVMVALEQATGRPPAAIWHRETVLPDLDLVVLPGGFSYGDYLRAGAMAAQSPIMRAVVAHAEAGRHVLGICNGFQIAIEAGLLPGALLRNAGLHFVCRDVWLRVENAATPFTRGYRGGDVIRVPVAHHDGNYFADPETLARLRGEGRVAFRYCAADGDAGERANPNGSADDIAGILNERGNVLGLMPHPERLADPALGGTDGRPMFTALVESFA
ncbi:phosphoribosylformylglycinamidine synthase subunit PurQ [Oceanibacterium hippocampi]|uniref:Phosphoribosylformylglycinamidine synthase subunit PurQ n=1 Tax=Oceanibacterium hippocampi TaxID=745714 RepID=A0A1Y5T620_9PROT|nr:phosphoribosylformylglycinamidine synthase subunit PurQ [Oceanibacterium hippocampi]SLN56273.1 Phosphoribosylformylglycinamidine synthase 1 [Oceanibacterium hippocampi]